MKTGCVALVLCLNISVDPPDVIKIFPCARMECWIGLLLPLISFILIFFISVVCTLKNFVFLNSIKCLYFVINFLHVHASYCSSILSDCKCVSGSKTHSVMFCIFFLWLDSSIHTCRIQIFLQSVTF